MKMPPFVRGLILPCLLMLSACASAPNSPVPPPTVNGCPRVTVCRLPASQPTQNGQLLNDTDRLERAWHDCAAQVDMILACQQKATP